MQTVKITRHTSVDNKTAFEGEVLSVSDHTARVLVGYGAAELTDSEAVVDEPKRPGRKPKQTTINEGES